MTDPRKPHADNTEKRWQSQQNVELIDTNLHLQNLEERVLYSAVPVPVDLVEFAETDIGQDVDLENPFETVDQGLDLISNGLEQYFSESGEAATLDLSEAGMEASEIGVEQFELVVVDKSVEGYQELVDDILNRHNPDVHYEIAIIDSNLEGVSQLSRILSENTSDDKAYNAVHLVTHGSDATLNLGATQVNGSNLHSFASEIISWQDALTDEADILIYGCDVAETELGEQFVQELADLTGADLAASDDITGHQSFGGDWQFELVVGQIDTDVVFSTEVQANWMHSLNVLPTGAEVSGESGTAVGRSLDINDNQMIVQVYSQDLGGGNGLDIFYQISDADGLGAAVQVNTSDASGTQQWASVAVDNDGDFVVVWTDDMGVSGQGVFAKYFAADGSVIRDEFRVDVDSGLTGGNDASVAMDANGNFVVVWEGSGPTDGDGIYAKRFDTTGAGIGSAFLVNDVANAAMVQGNADVDMNDAGQFVIAWDTYNDDFTESEIYARWYESNGVPVEATSTLVDSDITQIYFDPTVSINNSGNFVVAYTSDADQDVKDAGGIAATIATSLADGVFASTYSVSGSTITQQLAPMSVHDTADGDQHSASVTLLDNDKFIVAWEGKGSADRGLGNEDDAQGVFYQTFDFFGGGKLLAGGESFVDTKAVSGYQQDVAVSSNGTDFVFGFEDNNQLTLAKSFNYAPVSENTELRVGIGFTYTLGLDDFSYIDSEGELLDHIVLDALPPAGQGELQRGGVTLVVSDTITRAEIENGDIRFVPSDSAIGAVGSIVYRTSDGMGYSAQASIQIEAEYSSLLISTAGTQSLDTVEWNQQDIVGLGGPDFALGSDTSADAYHVLSLDYNLDGFHFVNKSVTIPLATPVNLNPGDVVFSVVDTDTFPGVGTTQKGDLILFQPGSPGDYDLDNGTFSILTSHPSNQDLKGITIVESDTVVGDTTLNEGEILYSRDDKKIYRLSFPGGSAQSDKFLDGLFEHNVFGLELIESTTTVGGVTLTEGQILVSMEENGSIAGFAVQDNDIAVLSVTETEIGSSTSSGSAAMFFDASDVSGLSGGGSGDITAISLVTSASDNTAPTMTIGAVAVDENSNGNVITNTILNATDANVSDGPENLTYEIMSSASEGTLRLAGVAMGNGDTFTQQDVNDGLVTYDHAGGESATETIGLRLSDGLEDGVVAQDFNLVLNVNNLNDAPVMSLGSVSVNEGSVGNTISTAHLSATDADVLDAASSLTYQVTAVPNHGTLFLNGSELGVGDTFTQSDVNAGNVTYDHSGAEDSSDQVSLSLSDGLEDGVTAQAFVLNFDVTLTNDPVSNLNTGIEINTTGEDTYFIADNGDDVFGGATELTYEVTFSSIVTQINTLASYRTPTDSSDNADAFRLAIYSDGAFAIVVGDHEITSTAMDYRLLNDGQIHSVAVSWDSADGGWYIHVDGEVVDHGLGFATGEAINSGGEFVFGHEQDSVDGGYTNNNEFKGRVYDIRVWDSVQSVVEIQQNYDQQFAANNVPEGLVANWQFNDLQSGDTVVDVVTGNDLTLRRIAGFDFAEVATTLTVDESSANGTSVGYVIPTNSEYFNDLMVDGSFTEANEPTGGGSYDYDEYFAGETLGDWSVTNNSVDLRGSTWEESPLGGRALDLAGDQGQGTIEQVLDTVVGQEYTVSFVMSGNFEGFFPPSSQSLDVLVDGVASGFSFDEPSGWSRSNLQWETKTLTFTATSTSTFLEFEATSGTNRGALISDVAVVSNSNPVGEQLTYKLTDDADGRFSINSATGEITVADSSQLDFETDTSHVVEVAVRDGDGQDYFQNVTIQINDVNDPSTVSVSDLTVNEGSTGNVVSNAQLNAQDVDTGDASLVYTLTNEPLVGELLLNGTVLSLSDTFTQDDVENGLVTYNHDGSEGNSDAAELDLDDGDTVQSITFNVNIDPVNDAPVLAVGTFSLPDVTENSPNPSGETVQNILDGAGNLSHADSDGDEPGIAVVGVDDSNGQWQYSLDNGVSWTGFASQGVSTAGVDEANGLVLDEDARIRFVPNTNFSGTAGDLSFRLWDQTDGSLPGSVGDVSYSDDTDPVSLNIETLSVTIDSVDGISNTVPGTQTTDYEQPVEFSSLNGNAITVSDGDAGTNAVLRVTLQVNDGVLNLNSSALSDVVVSPSSPDGSDMIVFGGTESQLNAALEGLVFTPDLGFDGGASISVTTDFDYGMLVAISDPPADVDPSLIVNDPDRGDVVQFSGSEYIEVWDSEGNPTQLGEPESVTIAGWVNYDSGQSNGEFISIGNSVVLRLDSNSHAKNVTAFFDDGIDFNHTTASFGVSGTGWHHIAYTIDATSNVQVLYVDGVAVETTNYTEDIQYSSYGTFIGSHPFRNNLDLVGQVDDIRFYERALTASEIANLNSENYSDTDVISVIVPANEAPVAGADNLGVFQHDAPTTILASDLLSNDTDLENDTLTISSFTQPANGSIVQNADGDLVYTPDPGFSGNQEFEYTITDGTSNQHTATVTFIVNDVPDAEDDSFSVVKDTPFAGDVGGNDSDVLNSGLTYVLSDDVDNGNLTLNSDGTFSYTPSAGFFGADSFTYSIDDGVDQSELATVQLNVLAPPVAVDDHVSVDFNETASFSIIANDFDPDESKSKLTMRLVDGPDFGSATFDAATRMISYTAKDPTAVTDQILYELVDSDGQVSSVATVHITINHAPQLLGLSNADVDEHSSVGTVVGTVMANDLNSDIASFSLVDDDMDPSNNPFSIDANTGEITVRDSAILDFETSSTFEQRIMVEDASGLQTEKVYTITINPVDEAPVAPDLVRSVDEGAIVHGDLSKVVSDPESDIESFKLVSGPANGALDFNDDGTWSYHHDDSENFVDSFTYQVEDASGLQTIARINLDVTPVDDAPVANADLLTTEAVKVLKIDSKDLLSNDQHIKSTAEIEIVTQPKFGILVQKTDGSMVYVPNVAFGGIDEFEYKVKVDGQTSGTAKVSLAVVGVISTSTVEDVPEVIDTAPVVVEEVLEGPAPDTDDDDDELTDLTGPIVNQSTGGVSQNDNDNDQVGGDFLSERTELAEEAIASNQRSILWQPRYANLGDQLVASATVTGGAGGGYSVEGSLDNLVGLSLGFSGEFSDQLDGMELPVEFADIPLLSFSATSFLTVGYLVWAFRAGALVSTFISVPAWTQFDPLPVIEKGIPVNLGDEDDSLEKLVDTL